MPDLDELMAALGPVVRRARWPVVEHRYGPLDDHVGDLRLPSGGGRPHPVVILLHGGFWRERYRRDLMTPLAVDLARRGFASWNLEYRRVGTGGGVPATLDDVAAAVAALPRLGAPVDLRRVAVVGHSAGGHLALVAARQPRVSAAVALAGVCDLSAGYAMGIGAGAVADFVGGSPDDHAGGYDLADPMRALPLGVRQLLVHGTADEVVPLGLSRSYAARAGETGDSCELVEVRGADHFTLIDPRTAAWGTVVEWLHRALGRVR